MRGLLVVFVVSLTAGAAASQHPAPGDTARARAAVSPTIEFDVPPFDIPDDLRDTIRFGWLTVPQDHDDPTAGSIRLAFAIIAARTAEPAADPIVIIPGGPGSPHVAPSAVAVARSERAGIHRQRRAIVLLDPRGHGLSEPRTCPELDGSTPLNDEDDVAETIFMRKLAACRARLDAQGVRLQTLSSVHAARDIDLLRSALGAQQVNLIGGSYGTRIIAEAMRQVPWAIRAVMMHGPVPPAQPPPGDEQPAGVMTVLFSRCAERPECQAAFPHLPADYDSVLARTARSPLIVRLPRSDRSPSGQLRVDSTLLRSGFAELGFTRQLTAGGPLLIHTLAVRGMKPLAKLAPQLITMLESDDIAVGTFLAFRCNDDPRELLQTTPAQPLSGAADAAGAADSVGAVGAADAAGRCRAWIGDRFGDSIALPLRSDIPALILAGEFDPRTPPSNARLLAGGLSRAHVAVLPWTGHDRLPDCAFQITDAFIETPSRAPDTSCLDSIPPVRFATGVVPSDWIAGAVARASVRPIRVAGLWGIALVLLFVPFIGLPVRALRHRRSGSSSGSAGRGHIASQDVLVWMAAATGVALLIGAAAAVVVGARENILIPGLGVPQSWRWVLLLPWLLLSLALASLVLRVRQTQPTEWSHSLMRGSGMLGAFLVLGLWALYSLV